MTTKELRGQFDFYYGLESTKRKVPQIDFVDQQFLLMYSNAMVEISDRLKMIKDFISISLTPVTQFTEYTLGQDYGGFIKAELFDASGNKMYDIPEGDYSEINTAAENLSTEPQKVIIYADGLNYKLVLNPNPNMAGTLKLHYLKTSDLYAPSKGTTQQTPVDWNPQAGIGYNVVSTTVPDKYIQGAIYHMLAQIFDDMTPKFEAWIYRMKASYAGTKKKSTNYKMGGVS